MATVKVSQLTEKTVLADADLFPIVDAGQSSSKKVKYSTVKNDIRPYGFCAGYIEQTLQDDPVVSTIKNILGGDVTFTRNSEGIYLITSNELFTPEKTILFINSTINATPVFVVFEYYHESESEITLYCYDVITGLLCDINSTNPIPFKIEVYN